jgi:hypothetical protein
MKIVVVFPSLSNVNMASTHLVKYSTATMMYRFPLDEARWNVIKYTPDLVNGPTMMMIKIGAGCTHLLSKYLTRTTFLDCFKEIFEKCRPDQCTKYSQSFPTLISDCHMLHHGIHLKLPLPPHE